MSISSMLEKLEEGLYLNVIHTNKFKTNLVNVYILRPLNREEVTKNALIPLILRRGTKEYKTSLDIQKRLEELYGSNLSINVNKKGERQIIRFTIEGPDSDIVASDNLLKDQLKMLYNIITNPLLEKELFSVKYVEQEKKNLKKKIEGRVNNKKQYALDRCIEEMCKNENYRLYKYGYTEDIEKITNSDLYKHYKEILKTSPIFISVVGNVMKEDIVEQIKNIFKFRRDNIIEIPREDVIKAVVEVNKVFDEMDVNQGKLTLGYRTNVPYEDELYESLLLASNILGGGPNSKLFENVREKESLAYYVYSKSYKFKSIMLIASGIEFQNYDKALDIIRKQVEDMKKGKFEQGHIENSKSSLITAIKSMTDNNFSLAEFYLSQFITNDNRSINQIINNLKVISKDNVVEAAKKLSLDTIYFLKKK
ncbi:EF-P 5-aminopentanol modification-associated protein YfmF [Caldisalinibacter kiritimatiensis]|uniref:Zinc protease n=1 Tax=Caldisalinibacter kiritimatiensis TaxID=1304284 RepID=R1CX94_9FIRM|nr:pitrilysin family protein [Caldisalinibacter kiritimatiensis]EOD01249.1 Zinc protease [Caldisalinibacter kiritimatiensis]